MSNRNDKHNKKEEQKKRLVGILCLFLIAAMTLPLLVSMIITLFF